MPRQRTLPLVLAATLAATGVSAADAAPRRSPRPTVVVAVPDSGVNPYHEVFYRPGNTAHPCTYVAGFSCDVPALRLSVGKHADYAKAVAADRELWNAVKPHQWYWIPKTNIIGAVCAGDYTDPRDPSQVTAGAGTCILDDHGHGTGTASSVLSEAPDALLLVHEGDSTAADLATAPVRPDVHSHSWGPPAPLPLHVAEPALRDFGFWCGEIARRPESLFFIGAGNEAPFPAILDCDRFPADVHIVGGGYPGHWSFASWTTADFASWFCRPVAARDATKGSAEACGTSFSAPTAAGAAADALLRLRRQDRYTGRSTTQRVSRTVTRAAFEQALRDGATYAPEPKFASGGICTDYVLCTAETAVYGARTPLPEQAPYVFWGYGWLDSTVVPAIVSCVRGGACPKKPAEATRWNDARNEARTAYADAVAPAPQHDAASGRDAGDDRRGALPVVPGRAYTATIDPWVTGGDDEDWYTFRATAGQLIGVASTGSVHPDVPVDVSAFGCWFLVAPNGVPMDPDPAAAPLFSLECESTPGNEPPTGVRAPATGTYAAVYVAPSRLPRHDYRFTVTVGR